MEVIERPPAHQMGDGLSVDVEVGTCWRTWVKGKVGYAVYEKMSPFLCDINSTESIPLLREHH